MLFQVVLAADHLAATAVAELWPDRIGPVGLLELCHSEDSALVTDDGTPITDHAAAPCVLCAAAAVAGLGPTPVAPVVVAPVVAAAPPPVVAPETIPVRPPLRYGSVRGPPPSVCA